MTDSKTKPNNGAGKLTAVQVESATFRFNVPIRRLQNDIVPPQNLLATHAAKLKKSGIVIRTDQE